LGALAAIGSGAGRVAESLIASAELLPDAGPDSPDSGTTDRQKAQSVVLGSRKSKVYARQSAMAPIPPRGLFTPAPQSLSRRGEAFASARRPRFISPIIAFFRSFRREPEPPPLVLLPPTGYRTVCVRLCDGYFFPVSFSTLPDRFRHDTNICEQSCSSPARLFVYRNPGGGPETMEDLEGRPYSALTTAFQFRTAYDASCTCKPQPWSEQARLEHRVYALEAAKRKGDKGAAAELKLAKAAAEEAARAARERPQGVGQSGSALAEDDTPRARGVAGSR
jgi:hypothetical protein